MKTVRDNQKLLVKFTEDEMQAVVEEHSDVCSALSEIAGRKKIAVAAFAKESKPFEERRAELEEIKAKGGEEREVECEWRDGLVNGQLELVRLDTGEVVKTKDPEPEDVDTAQPSLFGGARPTAPTLVCSALNDDGEAWSITAEQADAAERAIAESGSAKLDIEGITQTVTRIARGKACPTCSIVGGHHRPECAELQAEGGEEAEDDYDPNDTAQVAAKIAEGPTPPDGPVRGHSVADATAKPRRKRGAKAEEAEGVH